jgi:hypothetical protein
VSSEFISQLFTALVSQGPYPSSCPSLPGPLLDPRTKPQFAAALSEVHHGSRHVRVPMLVSAHAVGMGEAEQVGDPTGFDQVGGINSRHRADESTTLDMRMTSV